MRPLALLALLLAAAGCGGSTARVDHPATTTKPSRFAGAELTPPRPAPPLTLHDAHGRTYSLAAQRGRYTLVTFLYTNCPDVCPLIASNLNTALRILGPHAKVSVLAVSVDPKGDTPAAVRAYEREKQLVPQFHYLIGSRPELMRVWRAWNEVAIVSKPAVISHVTYTALIDPSGKERVLYDAQVKAQQVVHDLRLLSAEKNTA
jgi:protein SCO1